jgi:hypothetical protein
MRKLALLVSLWGVSASPALAWNDRGHMLAAMVAYQQMTPETRARVNEILRHHPQYDLLKEGEPTPGPDQDLWVFLRAATWPDMVRSPSNPLHGAEHHAQWHYINFPVNESGKRGPQPVEKWNGQHEPANLLQAVEDMKNQLEAKSTKDDRRAIDLCWMEHLVGDIHQPLHAVSLFSSAFPEGDKGGNSFTVKRGETPTNLHSYWDGILGRDVSVGTLKSQIEGWEKNPDLSRAKLLGGKHDTDVAAWAHESRDIAEHQVYLDGRLKGVRHTGHGDYPKDIPALPSGYEEAAKRLAAKRIMLAGFRMADELGAVVALSSKKDLPATPRSH